MDASGVARRAGRMAGAFALVLLIPIGCRTARPDPGAEQIAAAAIGLDEPIVFRAEGGPVDEPAWEGGLTLADATRRAATTDPGLQAALARVRIAMAEAPALEGGGIKDAGGVVDHFCPNPYFLRTSGTAVRIITRSHRRPALASQARGGGSCPVSAPVHAGPGDPRPRFRPRSPLRLDRSGRQHKSLSHMDLCLHHRPEA